MSSVFLLLKHILVGYEKYTKFASYFNTITLQTEGEAIEKPGWVKM